MPRENGRCRKMYSVKITNVVTTLSCYHRKYSYKNCDGRPWPQDYIYTVFGDKDKRV